MRKPILFSFLLFSWAVAQGQAVSVKKSVFAGGFNEIKIESNKYPCSEIFLTTNNGNLTKQSGCWYNFIPTDTGLTVVNVHLKKGKQLKKIDTLTVLIKEPTVHCFIGSSSGGSTSKHIFAANEYMRVESFDFGCTYYYPFTVDSFWVQIKRNDAVIFQQWNVGARLSNEVQSAFQQLQINDAVIITDIIGQSPNRKRRIDGKTICTITE